MCKSEWTVASSFIFGKPEEGEFWHVISEGDIDIPCESKKEANTLCDILNEIWGYNENRTK